MRSSKGPRPEEPVPRVTHDDASEMASQETAGHDDDSDIVETLRIQIDGTTAGAARTALEAALPRIRVRHGGAVVRVANEVVLKALRKMVEGEFGVCETTRMADVFELIFKVPQSGVKGEKTQRTILH